jgi:hypothetical protein
MKRLAGALLVVAVAAAVALPAAPAEAKTKPSSPTVGSTIKTRRVNVTLRAYRQPVGADAAAINVAVCNTTSSTQAVGPYQFFLETPDRQLVFPAKTIETPRPQLRATPVTQHHCTRGWVSYRVPAGVRAASVVFQAGAMFTPTLHRWTVPKA